MKSGFKDPTAVKKQKPIDLPEKTTRKVWEEEQPQYDERSSCFVNCGTHYGVGHRQPVGTEKHSGKSAVPMGRAATMRVDEVG